MDQTSRPFNNIIIKRPGTIQISRIPQRLLIKRPRISADRLGSETARVEKNNGSADPRLGSAWIGAVWCCKIQWIGLDRTRPVWKKTMDRPIRTWIGAVLYCKIQWIGLGVRSVTRALLAESNRQAQPLFRATQFCLEKTMYRLSPPAFSAANHQPT